MTDTLFSQADATPEAITPIGEFDPNTDYTASLVGEQKKYSDNNKLAYSALKKDEFIEQLKQEQAALRQELKSRISVEDALKKVAETAKSPSNESRQPVGNEQDPNKTSATPEETEALIERKLNQYAAQRTRAENVQEAQAGLRKSFGDKYVTKLDEISATLGVDRQFMDNLAATNPKVFLRTVGATETVTAKSDAAPVRSTVNTEQFVHVSNGEKKWSDYRKLQQDNPNLYWSPKVQNELMGLVAKHGEAYYKT